MKRAIMFKVSYRIRPLKDGIHATIYGRILRNGQRSTDFSVGETIPAKRWNNKTQMVTGNEYQYINLKLAELNRRITQIHLDRPTATAREIQTIAFERKQPTQPTTIAKAIAKYFNQVDLMLTQKTITKATHKDRRTKINKLLQYAPNHELQLFNHDKAADYCQWLINHGHTPATINKYIASLKMLIDFAIKNNLITENPIKVKISKPKIKIPEPVTLTAAELERLEQLKPPSEFEGRILDLFLFGCYTGMAYVDIYQFNPLKHLQIRNGRQMIIIERQKSGSVAKIILLPKAKFILEKYGYALPKYELQVINRIMKTIAQLATIDKNLTTHVARKTFARHMSDAGFSLDVISRMLGHASVNVTQRHYLHVSEERILSEAKNLNL